MSNLSSRVYWVGPRKITAISGRAIVILGKSFIHLKGKKVMVKVVIIEEGVSD